MHTHWWSLLRLTTALGAMAAPIPGDALPVVDLGYELHQALVYNDTLDFYVFSNIRYAQPPTGNLRFRAPLPPVIDRNTTRNGNETRICAQGIPPWQAAAESSIKKFEDGAPFSLQAWEEDLANAMVPDIDLNAQTTEDCLFLDVVVPSRVLGQAVENKNELRDGAAVLVWIHGGGWVLGSKNDNADPVSDVGGLMHYGNAENGTGMIFVGLNYRLGALGWLAGESVQADGDLNVGLLDQRLALQWVQDNIHLFGGNASKVTIMGESAGGGGIMLQYTTDPHTQKPLFNQLIPQSPGLVPTFAEAESTYTNFLNELNATTLTEIRQMSSSDVITANAKLLSNAPPTTYLFNPVLDNKFVPTTPKELFDSKTDLRPINILTGVNSFEGSFFFDPKAQNESAFLDVLANWLPGTSQARLDQLASSIYPPIFDGSLGYVDWATRQSLVFAEGAIYCNAELLNARFAGSSYAYEFAVSPGFHVQDLDYTFDSNPSIPAPEAKYTLQRAIASFVVHGTPYLYTNSSAETSMPFPVWDPATRLAVNITAEGGSVGVKEVGGNATRCEFWQTGIFA